MIKFSDQITLLSFKEYLKIGCKSIRKAILFPAGVFAGALLLDFFNFVTNHPMNIVIGFINLWQVWAAALMFFIMAISVNFTRAFRAANFVYKIHPENITFYIRNSTKIKIKIDKIKIIEIIKSKRMICFYFRKKENQILPSFLGVGPYSEQYMEHVRSELKKNGYELSDQRSKS